MLCSVQPTSLFVAEIKMVLSQEVGSSQMELDFLVRGTSGTSTEPEVRWWYSCIVEEVEWRGSTTVRYLIQCMSPRTYTLECTQQTLVSDNVSVIYCYIGLCYNNEEIEFTKV